MFDKVFQIPDGEVLSCLDKKEQWTQMQQSFQDVVATNMSIPKG